MFTKALALAAFAATAVRAATVPADDMHLIKRNATVAAKKRDNECNMGLTKNADDGSGPYVVCYSYCEHTNQQITGDPVTVGSDIHCDTSSCSDLHSQTYTVSQSFSINIGLTVDSDPGEADVVKGGASAGASWSWSSSSATSDAFTFSLKDGDVGHVVFRPYFQQSCGDLQYYQYQTTDDGFSGSCSTDIAAEDTNACGQTPIMINNFADGEFTFCYTAGDRSGEGC